MIDVCLVTKNDRARIPGLEYVPVHNLIIETSKPLGQARMRAIQKVKTEWFAFVDDDVSLFPSWFSCLWDQIRPDIGAISGYLEDYGYNQKVDYALSHLDLESVDYKKGERWTGTHSGLIRTDLVRDWTPSRSDLSSWEDYEITQHILRKGYRVIKLPIYLGRHRKGYRKMVKNTMWNLEGEIRARGLPYAVKMVLRSTAQIMHVLFIPSYSREVKFYYVYQRYLRGVSLFQIILRRFRKR